MKDILSSHKLSPIELAKRINTFRSLSDTKQDFEQIKKTLIPQDNIERVNQIIRGLEQEDEFSILCKLMGTCESIYKIDQNPIIETDEKGADFIASFHPGCSVQGLSQKDIKGRYSCFIEVKSCQKNTFKITKKDLNARYSFAKRFRLPLIFAIRFMLFDGQCYWILIDSRKLEKQGRKVEISQLIGTLGPVLFNDYGLFTHPALHLIHYYSSENNLEGIKHQEYGVLVKTGILIPDIDPIILDDNISVLANAVLDNFDFKTTQVESEDNITCVISHIGSQARFLSDMIYRINNLARDESGDKVYDPTRIVSRIDSENDKPTLITREMVEYVVSYLNQKEMMFFKMTIGEQKQQEKILRSLMKKG